VRRCINMDVVGALYADVLGALVGASNMGVTGAHAYRNAHVAAPHANLG